MIQLANGVFAQRRERFLAALDGGIALFPGAPETVRNGDVHHRYRQDSDFYYLTGFTEPGAFLVLDAGHPKKRFTLFVQPKDPAMERWTGRRVGEAGARRRFGADAAADATTFYEQLPTLLKGRQSVFLRLGADERLDQAVLDHIAASRAKSRAGETGPTTLVDPTPVLGEMRLFKCDDEIELLRQALAATAEGHLAAMRITRPGMYEYQVEAAIEYHFRMAGAVGPAYGTICGSGDNATILHYVENDRRMKKGDLLLIDAGAEVAGYAGDVTRTIPVSGRYTDPQKAVYDVVLAANHAAIHKVKPGVTFDAVHKVAVKKVTEGLIHLGLLNGPVAARVKDESYRRFYMHRTSHWLGLDVHDAGRYHTEGGGSRPLAPGMVLTIEPGLYIDPDKDIPKPFQGIGIRIEDDVLVTEDGHQVLSSAIPKETGEIERIMAAG